MEREPKAQQHKLSIKDKLIIGQAIVVDSVYVGGNIWILTEFVAKEKYIEAVMAGIIWNHIPLFGSLVATDEALEVLTRETNENSHLNGANSQS